VLAAYLIGSLSFAVIVSQVMGLSDPRTYGSHNPGATNVLRSGSKVAAALTLLLDAVKGWLPVWAAHTWADTAGWSSTTVGLVALAAFLGHLYPVFFGFKGGKGVATAAGVLMGVSWMLGVATLLTWGIVVYATRYSSLGALVAAVFAPLFYLFGADVVWETSGAVVGAIVVMSGLLVWRHSDNIGRLLQGKESKLGSKKK
jgi:glycerol-3-phosphate acyltransferase PlsY